MLIIAFLEARKKTRRGESIADALWALLIFYGTEFNAASHGICASYRQEEETGNPFFDIPNYLKGEFLIILDPTQRMLKNITPNSYNFSAVQAHLARAAGEIYTAKQQFFDELHREMKEQGGVKKDYFLSYNKKKDRVLDTSRNICEEALRLRGVASTQILEQPALGKQESR